jgi:CRISPR-associated exonuclease Cas4
MSAQPDPPVLPDLPARLRALTNLDSTLLIEAAAGTGKTALIAGRVTVCFTKGIEPRQVAAITFNELAASELSARIHKFVAELRAGNMPECLRPAFPDGLTLKERQQLDAAAMRLDELTVTTIHGFCQRLIHSYAVEADIDPGARMMDAPQSDAAFEAIFQQWLRRRLSAARGAADPIAAMSEEDPLHVEKHLRALARFRRRHRTARPVRADLSKRLDTELKEAVRQFQQWLAGQPTESGTASVADQLAVLADFYAGCLESVPDFPRLWQLAHPPAVPCRRQKNLELMPPRRRGAWQQLAGKAEGARLADEADGLFASVNDCYRRLLGAIATALVEVLSAEIDEVLNDYVDFKRQAAVLDFDDLLHRARDLVRNHEPVRKALGERYRHILVDEFQDTDPIQAETLFRISATTSEPQWQASVLRPGALFMVGDPKQAIYRFRGADVRSYEQGRNAIQGQWPDNILQITANFRSVPGIIEYINEHFEAVLDAPGQPGYVPLSPVRGAAQHGLPCVAKRGLDLPPEPKANDVRDAEAAVIAELCTQLIGNLKVPDAHGILVPLAAGDIALLAPGGTELCRYEHALEARGLPIASSAGKSLLRRQEIQDFMALARALADSTDTLAFGALLRGPLVGLTEEELLDIAAALPVHDDAPDSMPRFTLNTDPEQVVHPLARETLTILRDLRRRALETTPALLLAEAAERLAARPLLHAREGKERSRAVANIERFIELARAYDVTGLKRFIHDVTHEWALGTNERTEGRVDAEGAIEIVTMHSSKGLEWPVVILINSITGLRYRDEFVHRPDDDTIHWVLGEVEPPELTRALEAENKIGASERQRLWYVACTRARELLIIPELPVLGHETWSGVVDNTHVGLPELPLAHFDSTPLRAEQPPQNLQTAEAFQEEETRIRGVCRSIVWRRPSDEDPDRLSTAENFVVDVEEAPEGPLPTGAGRLRGLLLHKLIEEVLTRELVEDRTALERRAQELMGQLTEDDTEAANRPQPDELAQTVLRTLALPDIVEFRPKLIPELALYDLEASGLALSALSGRADAVTLEGGRPSIVVDWKSDVAPDLNSIQIHASQLRDYIRAIGSLRGALVYMSTGLVHWVTE